MIRTTLPSEIHADATPDRLIVIAELIKKGRDNAVERHEPNIGDDGWILGSRAYKCSCHQIETASEELDWLEILDSKLEFQFKIGSMNMRFKKDDVDSLSKKASKPTLFEQPELFSASEIAAPRIFRIIVDADEEGRLLSAYFVSVVGSNIDYKWLIPLQDGYGAVSDISPTMPVGPDLPAPEVGPPSIDEDSIVASANDNKK